PIQGSWSTDRKLVVFVGSVPYDTNHPTPGPAPPPGQVRREHATLNDLDPVLNLRTEVDGSSALKQIFLGRADGSIQQLTDPWTEDWRDGVVTGDARSNTDPVLSPDGSSLVFTSHSTLTNESFLVRMDQRTGDLLNLTNGTAGAQRVDDSSARWSPDSSLIAFTWTEGSATDVFVMRASDGLEVTHVTDDLATNLTPSWSPDGRSIVYSHHDGEIFVSPDQLVDLTGLVGVYDTGWSLVSVDVATGHQTVLTRPGDPAGWKPVWAPEGDRIYFIGKGPDSLDVFSVSPAGGDVEPVLITPFLNETSIDWR
ncbi:MAG: TolB family protein, partial [Acidimicrobiales bacterium]